MEKPFLVRNVREDDLDSIHRLSKLVYFINLPSDKAVLKQKIAVSLASFSGEIEDKFERHYIFVLEDPNSGEVLGTSSLIARHGSPSEPHMYFNLREIRKYSETIHSGIIHKVLRLKFDYDGPTEIGGLVIDPAFRGHPGKLGRQLSFARFLFIKMNRKLFKNFILSELMPPLTEKGESILWENLGRKFTNLSYQEADVLSHKNKEFVTSLFPQGDIYTCLLSGEARDAIGKVGKTTEPVRHMLEKVGFSFRNHIDPFDGGPHYLAETDKITVIKDTQKLTVSKEPMKKTSGPKALCGVLNRSEFACVLSPFVKKDRSVQLPKGTAHLLGVETKDPVFVMPI